MKFANNRRGHFMYDCDSLSEYLKEIRKYSLLDFDQEMELSRQIQEGNINARRTLIESNLRLVVTMARKYVNDDCELMDIIQEGNLGLITAAEKYEFSYNVRFSTYACWWIQQSITRALANKRRMIRLPFRKEELANILKRTVTDLYQRLSRNPTNAEIAYEMRISEVEVADILSYSAPVVSLDIVVDTDESVCLQDLIADSTWDPEQVFIKKHAQTVIRTVLDELTLAEQEIIIQRYNLDHKERPLTLKAIGKKRGVSAETIRQVELRALRKLRSNSKKIREEVYCQ